MEQGLHGPLKCYHGAAAPSKRALNQPQAIGRLRAAGVPAPYISGGDAWRGCSRNSLLRVESLVITAGLLVLYGRVGATWVLFFAAILLPDLSIFGYAAGPRMGAAIYNLAHTYSLPLILGVFGLLGAHAPSVYIAVIWLTHISVDRMLGLGLKYPTAFKDTHLDRV